MAFQDWGQRTLKWAFERWLDLRRTEKQQLVFTTAGFDDWLQTRLPTERKVAERMVKELIRDDAIELQSAGPLLEIVKSSVESVAFRELVETIEDEGANSATLLRLFREWRVIEAREHLRRTDGRLSSINQLRVFIKNGALEVKELQPLFEQNPWLVDPSWSEADGQTTYTKLLRQNFVEKGVLESDRRLDILGVRDGGGVTIVELKRPKSILAAKHLRQIQDYVIWARANLIGTGPDAPKYINGILVIGRRNSDKEVALLEESLGGSDIRVETFADLYERAKEYYGFVERKLESIAPEYTRKSRKARGRK